MKVVVIREGEVGLDEYYQPVGAMFARCGFEVSYVTFSRRYQTLTEWVSEVEDKIPDDEQLVLFGFSLGALVAFAVAPKIQPKFLILCSMSPILGDQKVKGYIKRLLGKRRMKDLKGYSLPLIAKGIQSTTFIFAGEKEIDEVKNSARSLQEYIEDGRLTLVPDTRHGLDEKYLNALGVVVESLK